MNGMMYDMENKTTEDARENVRQYGEYLASGRDERREETERRLGEKGMELDPEWNPPEYDRETRDALMSIKSIHERRGEDPSERDRELMRGLGAKARDLLERNGELERNDRVFEQLLEARKGVLMARMDLWRERLVAAREGRKMTDVEYEEMAERVKLAEDELGWMGKEIVLPDEEEELEFLERPSQRSINAFNRWTLKEYGLMFDSQVVEVMDRLAMNVADGMPTLLMGEKGIAKTNIAKFMVELVDADVNGRDAIVSGHGDIMAEVFSGKTVLVADENGGTRTMTVPGKMVTAMSKGQPLIIDEINAKGSQTAMFRLQDWLLARPGEEIVIQEDGDSKWKVAPGFAVIGTMNEYANRDQLDKAFKDRFKIIDLYYPDVASGTRPEDVPESLLRMALAMCVDERGFVSKHINQGELEKFCRLAFLTERAATMPLMELSSEEKSVVEGGTSRVLRSEETAMSDCITPRSLGSAVERSSQGNGMVLGDEIKREVRGLAGRANQERAWFLWNVMVDPRVA